MSSNYIDLPVEGGVTSLNGLTGMLSIVAGTDITVTTGVSTITISSTSSGLNSIGTYDSQPKSANGLVLASNVLYAQSADATHTGMVNTGSQTFAGTKTFAGAISASNLSGTNSGDVTIGTANGLSLAAQVLSLGLSSTSTTGALSSTDWNTFNNKQAAGSYITALTGDVTAVGPGAAAATVAKIQGTAVAGTTGTGNVVFSASPTLTGTLSAAAATFSGAISASNLSGTNTGDVTLGTANGLSLAAQVLSLGLSSTSTTGALSSTDWNTFNNKQPAGSYITALTGDVVATGPGSVSATIQPLSVTNSKIANATIDLTTKVTNVLPAANGGSPPTTKNLYVDAQRTDTFTADGSWARPFATISAAISQIITNADNSTNPYEVTVLPGGYNETLSFNSTTLYNIVFQAINGATINAGGNVIQSTSNNTQLATLAFTGFTINGGVVLTGDINNTNFGSSQIIFTNCSFNLNATGVALTNVNNVSFYGGQLQGGSANMTWQNVAFAYMQGAEGMKSGETLHLVQNNGANQPSQSTGNYFLMSETKMGGTVTIDAGSELDAIQSYFSSASSVTNNGIIHSFGSSWSGTTTLNAGSVTRLRGDLINTNPTLNGGAVTTNQSTIYLGTIAVGSSATPATNALIVAKDGHYKSTQTTAPTTTTNSNAGTGATSSVSHATDTAGTVNLTTGTLATSAGIQTTINFNKTYNVAPIVTLTAANINAANNVVAKGIYVTSTTSGFSVNFATAETVGTAYVWNYMIMETQ